MPVTVASVRECQAALPPDDACQAVLLSFSVCQGMTSPSGVDAGMTSGDESSARDPEWRPYSPRINPQRIFAIVNVGKYF